MGAVEDPFLGNGQYCFVGQLLSPLAYHGHRRLRSQATRASGHPDRVDSRSELMACKLRDLVASYPGVSYESAVCPELPSVLS